ncbi:MAG: MaoC family dehydratase N-terminal domain-containing protein [Pseudomonadota bacterium]
MTQIDVDHLQSWIGRRRSKRDHLTAFPANALAATLDRDDPGYASGMPLPPLWHWLYFLEIFKLQDAGYDGHAALGGFLPPVPLPRRMWAGSRLRWHRPLMIGAEAEKRSEILSVKHRRGRSGDLVFVTVQHDVLSGGQQCLNEEHDIVYRAPAPLDAPVRKPPTAGTGADFSRKIAPSPVLLFRYSALTFNGHRIHYDTPFCKGTEGYEGLVVHGPLLATLMLDALRRHKPGAKLTGFEFRAQAPVFDTEPFHVEGRLTSTASADLWIRRADGAEAMRGAASFTL